MKYILILSTVLAAAVLPLVSALGQTAGSIEIDSVVGSYGPTLLMTGTPIVFRLHYSNPEDHSWNISNGFVIFSPDGATWGGPTAGDLTGLIPSSNFDLAFAMNAFSCGSSPCRDTLGIIGAAVYNPGLPSGFDEVPYGISIGTLSADDAGKHICVDSCWFRTGGYWKWTASGGISGYPTWAGPYCFEIASDPDEDGVPDGYDNCPADPNPLQEDGDTDDVGDVCDNCPEVANTDQTDQDTDTFGAACDCDDNDPSRYPGATEVADDGVDQDCNGVDAISCFEDLDADGFGTAAIVVALDGECNAIQHESTVDTDCDDGAPGTYPGAPEIPKDGIDQDCDGIDKCCAGRTGDANGEGDYPDEVTLGDIMLLVDVKFISGDCSKLPCDTEADVNQDGGAEPTCEDHVTLGDIMTLVDFLFITGPENATLPGCL